MDIPKSGATVEREEKQVLFVTTTDADTLKFASSESMAVALETTLETEVSVPVYVPVTGGMKAAGKVPPVPLRHGAPPGVKFPKILFPPATIVPVSVMASPSTEKTRLN